MIYLSDSYWMTLDEFTEFIKQAEPVHVDPDALKRLDETRTFIDHLLANRIKVYGLTTGLADLRNTSIQPNQAEILSQNMIRSHDAGIGSYLPLNITLGAMVLRAHSLSKGYSGFSRESFLTLLQMINQRIIPWVPCTGSLGASGDLAFLARLGRAMMGEDVPVAYQGQTISSKDAFHATAICPFKPKAKEGLALTNGTPFMGSMLAIAYAKELRCLENLLCLTGLFLNAIDAIDSAFSESLQTVRYQKGQCLIAEKLRPFLNSSDVKTHTEVQNDYSIRCLPQIYGPRFELILEQRSKIESELNAVTDNPLIFRGSEISPDVHPSRILSFDSQEWTVLSGGNFHGEILTAIADLIALSNAKICLTIERQLTYLMNPFRNKNLLPTYLIAEEGAAGLRSGFMITQYAANALTHKICLLAHPSGAMNLTSANESEDIVSYGATACQRLLEQIDLFEELLSIFLLASAQAYSLRRKNRSFSNPKVEQIFDAIQSQLHFPRREEESFDSLYKISASLLDSEILFKEDPAFHSSLQLL